MKNRRLKHGEWKKMSPENQIKWKRFLQRRWRHNHPEFVTAQNKHYSELYKRTKPFIVTCAYCGIEFNAPRSSYRMCKNCSDKVHKRQLSKKQTQIARHNARERLLQEIISLWKSGVSQTEIAKKYNRTQSGISALLRRHNIIKKNCCKQKNKMIK